MMALKRVTSIVFIREAKRCRDELMEMQTPLMIVANKKGWWPEAEAVTIKADQGSKLWMMAWSQEIK